MKILNNYILSIASLLLTTTVILVALGQNSMEVYYTIYILEALIVTELYMHFSVKVRRALNFVSVILFGGFLFVILSNVIKILA